MIREIAIQDILINTKFDKENIIVGIKELSTGRSHFYSNILVLIGEVRISSQPLFVAIVDFPDCHFTLIPSS